MAYAYNQGRRIPWGQEFKTNLGSIARPISTKKIFLISQAWWGHVPVVLATQEDTAGESLEPGIFEAAVSYDHAISATERDPVSNKKKNNFLP